MSNRKILYGYQIKNGDLTIIESEAAVVSRIFTLYIEGRLSYQKISDTLNGDHVPFGPEMPLWNKHKVKRLLENPRYTGKDGYPAIIEAEEFDAVQTLIQGKTAGYATTKDRPALHLKPHLRCACCAGELHRLAGKNRRADTLYLKCIRCGSLVTIPDAALLEEVSRQIAEHDRPADEPYSPSAEVVRLTNAINRGLESPDEPESLLDLILQGASARYDCCPASTKDNPSNRPAGVDLKCFGQATRTGLVVSHITISAENAVTVCFK